MRKQSVGIFLLFLNKITPAKKVRDYNKWALSKKKKKKLVLFDCTVIIYACDFSGCYGE